MIREDTRLPIDLRKLRPAELLKLVNSTTEYGTVLAQKRLTRLRNDAGYRISADGQTVDLFKLAGHLHHAWRNPVPVATYEEKKEQSRRKSRTVVKAGQDIGEIPKVKKLWRKRMSTKNLSKFYRSYFPDTIFTKN